MGGDVEGGARGPPAVREGRGAAPRRQHGLVQLDREPALGCAAMCRWRWSESRDSRTARSLRRSSLTSRSTAHMEAVLPSASSTGSPAMCTVRMAPSGRTTRNSPSIGLPSTRQSVTIAVSTG